MEAKGPQILGKFSNTSGASLILQQQKKKDSVIPQMESREGGVYTDHTPTFFPFYPMQTNSILLG